MASVLKNFSLNPESENYITIETRESGIVNFLLNLVGLDPTYRMSCNNDSVDVDFSSLKGSTKQVVPLSAITEIVTSIEKPIKYLFVALVFLFVALVFFIGALFPLFNDELLAGISVFAIIVAIVFVVMYVLKKNILFAVKNGGDGYSAKIYCSPAVIAGERIDNEKFKAAAELLRNKINAAHK